MTTLSKVLIPLNILALLLPLTFNLIPTSTMLQRKLTASLDSPCRNLKISSKAVKTQAYQSLVLPRLEYAGTIWSPHTSDNIKKWNWCRDVVQGMCAIAGTIPAVLVRWLATSAGSPSLYVAIT